MRRDARSGPPTPVLLVTLSPDLVADVRSALAEGWEVVAVRSFFRVIDLLTSRPFAVIIADTHFQGGTRSALLETIAARDDIAPKPLRLMVHHEADGTEPPRPDLAPCEAVTRYPSGLDALAPVLRAMLKQRGQEAPTVRRLSPARPITKHEQEQRPTVRRMAAQPIDPSTVVHLAVETRTDESIVDLPELDCEPLAADEALELATLHDDDDAGLMTIDERLDDDDDEAPETRPLALAAPAASSLLARSGSFEAFVAEVDRRHAALATMEYHEILDLPESADTELLQRVFDVASLRFHPDRNRGIADAALRRRISDLYSAITEAYDVLSSPEHRERWQRARQQGQHRVRDALDGRALRLTELSANPGAQRFLRLAERAREDGDMRSALMNLRFALDLDPDNAQLDARVRQWQTAGH